MNRPALTRTRHHALFVIGLVAAVVLTHGIVRAAFPKATGYVTDEAALLTPDQRDELIARIREVEAKTSAEIAIATVSSLEGMSVEEYANKLFREWGVGKANRDNGVLILVAPNERKIRIEVGYGLEPILPDGLAGDIVRTNALPAFRAGDYPGGIVAVVSRVAAIVEAGEIVTPEQRAAYARAADDRPPALVMIPFLGAFIAIGSFALGYGVKKREGFLLFFGAMFAGIPFLMALVPFFNASPLVLAPLALVMIAVGWKRGPGPDAWRTDPRWRSNPTRFRDSKGAWTTYAGWDGDNPPNSSSSSSSDSSSSSSSSDSFGGGDSGGGGASGSW